MLKLETFRTVMLAAQIKLGSSTFKLFPLESMMRDSEMLATCVLNSVNRLLLLILIVPTVTRLIPLRSPRKVSVMVTLLAMLTPVVKVSSDKAGSADQSIVVTSSNAVKASVDRVVKFERVKEAPIVAIVELPNWVNP